MWWIFGLINVIVVLLFSWFFDKKIKQDAKWTLDDKCFKIKYCDDNGVLYSKDKTEIINLKELKNKTNCNTIYQIREKQYSFKKVTTFYLKT